MSVSIQTLQNHQFFDRIDASQLECLADTCEEETYSDGEAVVREGESGDRMYLILSGSLEVRKPSEDGSHSKVLDTLTEGSIFGAMSFISDRPRSADVVAQNDVRLLTLSEQDFREAIDEQDPAAVEMLWQLTSLMSDRLRRIDEEVVNLQSKIAGERQETSSEFEEFRSKVFAETSF